jgi:hypothetical protein
LVADAVLVIWCVISGWDNRFNITNMKLPRRGDLWNTWKNKLRRDKTTDEEPQERKESSDTCCGDPSIEDEKQGAKRQRSWPFMIFVRKSTVDPAIPIDDSDDEKSKV